MLQGFSCPSLKQVETSNFNSIFHTFSSQPTTFSRPTFGCNECLAGWKPAINAPSCASYQEPHQQTGGQWRRNHRALRLYGWPKSHRGFSDPWSYLQNCIRWRWTSISFLRCNSFSWRDVFNNSFSTTVAYLWSIWTSSDQCNISIEFFSRFTGLPRSQSATTNVLRHVPNRPNRKKKVQLTAEAVWTCNMIRVILTFKRCSWKHIKQINTLHCTLYTLHSTFYTRHFTFYTPHSTLRSTLDTFNFTLSVLIAQSCWAEDTK